MPLFWTERLSGCSSVRLECLVWDQVVEGSNPFIPTKGEAIASPLSCERIQGLLLFCFAKALLTVAWRPSGPGPARPISSFYFASQKRSLWSLGGPPGPRSRSKHSLAPIRSTCVNSQFSILHSQLFYKKVGR